MSKKSSIYTGKHTDKADRAKIQRAQQESQQKHSRKKRKQPLSSEFMMSLLVKILLAQYVAVVGAVPHTSTWPLMTSHPTPTPTPTPTSELPTELIPRSLWIAGLTIVSLVLLAAILFLASSCEYFITRLLQIRNGPEDEEAPLLPAVMEGGNVAPGLSLQYGGNRLSSPSSSGYSFFPEKPIPESNEERYNRLRKELRELNEELLTEDLYSIPTGFICCIGHDVMDNPAFINFKGEESHIAEHDQLKRWVSENRKGVSGMDLPPSALQRIQIAPGTKGNIDDWLNKLEKSVKRLKEKHSPNISMIG